MRKSKDNFIDIRDYDYESWKQMIFTDKYDSAFPNMCFPNDTIREIYLKEVINMPDIEVRNLLRKFLLKSCNLGKDNIIRSWLLNSLSEEKLEVVKNNSEYYYRLLDFKGLNWEGITWILDLLPKFPKQALQAIDSYFLAHCQFFPDYVFMGISDCEDIIRAKYFDLKHPQKIFLEIEPEEFEWLVEKLYQKMGYKTSTTKKTRDKGIDIVIEKKVSGKKEISIVQCKRKIDKISSPAIRDLAGVVADRKATKGILVCSSDFTKDSKDFAEGNPSIELIGYNQLSKLLNIHLGPDWPLSMKNIFREKRGEKIEVPFFWGLLDGEIKQNN